MSFLYGDVGAVSPYLQARQQFYTPEAWTKMINALKRSTTLYIGNLSFYTDEEQVYTLFSLCGPVRRVIMGIHKFTHLPCGFCFVEYYFHLDAMAARDYLNGTKLDDRIIRVDMDPGFEPDRQYGRGTSGGQVRDDRRQEYDEGRGGLPPRRRREMERHAVASGTLVGPTSGPLDRNLRQNRHRYERNMEANPHLRHQPDRTEMDRERPKPISSGPGNQTEDKPADIEKAGDGRKMETLAQEQKEDGVGQGESDTVKADVPPEEMVKKSESMDTASEELSEPSAKRQKIE